MVDRGGCATGFDIQELFAAFAQQPAGALLSYLNGHAALLSLGVSPTQLFPRAQPPSPGASAAA